MHTRNWRYHIVASMAVVVVCSITAPVVAQPRVAVLNFENNSTWRYWGDRLGEAAADELVTQLFQTGAFSVIERSQLAAVLAEQDLGASGAVDTTTAARIGQLLGAQLILTGSITQFSIERRSGGFRRLGLSVSRAESIVDVRLVNTTTGEIMLAESGEGSKTFGGGFFRSANFESEFDEGAAQEALRPAIENVVERIANQSSRFADLAPVTPPAQIVGSNNGSVYTNQGENYGVQIGRRYRVLRVIDEIRDANGTMLDRIVDQVGVVEVTRVLSQSAICTVIEGEASEGDSIEPL